MRYKPPLRSTSYCLPAALFAMAISGAALAAPPESSQSNAPMVLETMGIYWAGGQIVNRTDPALAGNQTLLGQAYVEYFIPQKKRQNAVPVVMTHSSISGVGLPNQRRWWRRLGTVLCSAGFPGICHRPSGNRACWV